MFHKRLIEFLRVCGTNLRVGILKFLEERPGQWTELLLENLSAFEPLKVPTTGLHQSKRDSGLGNLNADMFSGSVFNADKFSAQNGSRNRRGTIMCTRFKAGS
jgi:hypothetical protein